MITEPELTGGHDDPWDPEDANKQTISTQPTEQPKKPWTWAFGTVAVTSAAWLLALHVTHYGQAPSPDLHHYKPTQQLCSSPALKPLADALHTTRFSIDSAGSLSGPALDQVTCDLATQPTRKGNWKASCEVTITVDLHKKTNPTPEFQQHNSQDTLLQTDPSKDVTPVTGLGDEAYLRTGFSQTTITTRHGGAIFTIDVTDHSEWAGAGNPPADDEGFLKAPFDRSHLPSVLTATVRNLMTAASR